MQICASVPKFQKQILWFITFNFCNRHLESLCESFVKIDKLIPNFFELRIYDNIDAFLLNTVCTRSGASLMNIFQLIGQCSPHITLQRLIVFSCVLNLFFTLRGRFILPSLDWITFVGYLFHLFCFYLYLHKNRLLAFIALFQLQKENERNNSGIMNKNKQNMEAFTVEVTTGTWKKSAINSAFSWMHVSTESWLRKFV